MNGGGDSVRRETCAKYQSEAIAQTVKSISFSIGRGAAAAATHADKRIRFSVAIRKACGRGRSKGRSERASYLLIPS